jgi:hypothetical protein
MAADYARRTTRAPHHLGVIVRPERLRIDGGPEGHIPQECEYFGSDEWTRSRP